MSRKKGFRVMAEICKTCIYRSDSPLNLAELENAVRDKHIGFKGWRVCHHSHSNPACCRGFWNAHKDEFAAGQIAQRFNLVQYVNEDEVE